MITDGTSTGFTEQRTQQVLNTSSLQIITTKLASQSVQDRLKSLRQEHQELHIALDTFH